MSDTPADPSSVPPLKPTTPPRADPTSFPSYFRNHPLDSFADRWRAKQEDHDWFNETVGRANLALPPGNRLPDALVRDWLASWADDLFVGIVPRHNQLSPAKTAAAVEDVAAVVEALRFTERLTKATRVWFYELPGDPRMSLFPRLGDVLQHWSDWNTSEDPPENGARLVQYDQSGFLDAARFLLGTPTEEQWVWLRRLAYRSDPRQPIWDSPPRHVEWVRAVMRESVPELVACLGVTWPEIHDTLPVPELLRRVHNWLVQTARPELARRGWGSAGSQPAGASDPAPRPAIPAGSPGRSPGPEGGCWLWWDRMRHDVPKGTVYRLIAYFWDCDSAGYDELDGPVFDGPVVPQTVRSKLSATNKVLARIGVPWRLSADSTARVVTKQSGT